MALELLEGVKNYDYKVDLWSIGLCFWELLFGYGNFPFSLKSRVHLKNDIKNFSGKKLRFPKVPKFPEEVYDFFRQILQVSPRLRMNCDEFLEHPIWKFTGKEMSSQKNIPKEDNKEDEIANTLTPTKHGQIFTLCKEIYQKKITEIELIKETFENMGEMSKDSWDKDFLKNY